MDWSGSDALVSSAAYIPDHIDPTNPQRVFELDDAAQCRYLYEIVLTDGTPDDIARFIEPTRLAQFWDSLHLPGEVRRAWIDAVHVEALQAAADVQATTEPGMRPQDPVR